VSEKRKLWDQLDGEEQADYDRFLLYRDTGPGRSLDCTYLEWRLAHATVNGEGALAPGENGCRAPGSWQRVAREFRWFQRARAFDVHGFATDGQDTILAAYRYILRLALRGMASLDEDGHKPGSPEWDAHLKTVSTIVNLIPQASIEALLRARDAPAPDSGDHRGE
jgi:hypothetical protein